MTSWHRRYRPSLEILEERLTPAISITEFTNGFTGFDTAGITPGPDGNLWFTEPSVNAIGRITPAGAVTLFPDPAGQDPEAITLGPDGNLWFTDFNSMIGRITPEGVITHFPTTMPPSTFYQSITVGPDGNLWFTQNAGIGRITTAGVVTEFTAGISSGPTGITAGPDGALWFTENGSEDLIGRITTNGTVTEFGNGITPFATPVGITLGPDGNLWFTEFFEDQIGRITPQGVITEFKEGITCCSAPWGITTGPDGNLWFTERAADQIGEITTAGVVTEFGSGITQGSSPYNITTGPDGNLWFTEFNDPQIGKVQGVPIATDTALFSSGSPSDAGQAVTFTATVDVLDPIVEIPVTGSVTFLDDGIAIGSSPIVDGVASFTTELSAGTHHISAVFEPGGSFATSTSDTIEQTVEPPPPPPGPFFVVGADAGGGPQVNVYDAETGALQASFNAFAPSFTGGVRVALGDVNGDGVADIICGVGPGGGPQVAVYDGKTLQLIASFYAFAPSFTGGVYVAAGDVADDGVAAVICGAGAGAGPQVTVFRGTDGTLLASFYAFAPNFTGGVRVAAGDINGDDRLDIITAAGPGGGPQVTVFSGLDHTVLVSFYAFAANFSGGVFVAAINLNGDHQADIVTGAGAGGGPQITIFNGKDGAVLASFDDPRFSPTVTEPGVSTGIRVGATTVNGQAMILAAPGRGSPALVDVFNAQTLGLLDQFFAFDPNFRGGAFVGG